MVTIERVINAQPTRDGDGVLIRRSIGSQLLGEHDPFLLLDEIRSDDRADYIGGFPPHPHRGFETVTYMLEGRMRHRDSQGNNGVIEADSVQWMTAGRGVLHSEMPEQNEGRLWGFQFWINLAAADKMAPPRYQEFSPEQITEVAPAEGVLLRLIAGPSHGLNGPVTGIRCEPLLVDVRLATNTTTELMLAEDHNTVLYVYRGAVQFGDSLIASQQLAVLSGGGKARLQAHGEGAGALVLSARPINEPIARYGPFVMNTRAELEQAVSDLHRGAFGSL